MSDKKQQTILNLILGFVLLQPFFDVLSRLAILDILPNISTFIKPLFVFGMAFYLLFKYNPFKRKWLIYIIFFCLFTFGHLFLLYQLLVGKSLILHEFRFILNIAYMIALFISLFTLYHWCDDKQLMMRKIKYTLVYTFFIYFALYLIAIITGTSGMTYEYSDKYKLGFKGWNDSGQILGHAFSVMFPLILYFILKPNNHKIFRVVFLGLTIFCVSLLGTKVPYYITLIVLIIYVGFAISFKIFKKDFISSRYNIFIVMIAIITMVGTYQFTPVAYNTDINNKNAKIELSFYNLSMISGKSKDIDYKKLMRDNPNANLSYVKKYYSWGKQASAYLEKQFYERKLHPSNTRGKQLVYSYKKYMLSDYKYKLLGLGFLNQDSLLALESDFFMAIFNFGVIGFILFLFIPIFVFCKTFRFMLSNFKKIDFELWMLFMSLGIFFAISVYAGYTYIYTNFSIFLVLLVTMILLKIDVINENCIKKVKKVNFLALHLGFGGIESSIINSANSLADKYEIEIISFYHLKNDQKNKLKKNIKVTYLYNGEPNKDKIIIAKNNHNYINFFCELFKAIDILIKKKMLVKKAIKKINDGAIVSTRVEFNILLSKYGNPATLKIAQEHCYHNSNKKYINQISNCYYNIDYLCALTKTLYNDYKKFLKYNKKTKVVLLPNMLYNLPTDYSKLDKPNFLTVGRLDYGKRNNEIIDNFSKIKNDKSKLFIIGDGKEFNNLVRQVKELKLENRVEMVGYLSHEDQKKYFLNSCCFLMASITEGLPMVLLEAMSFGVPCVVYKTASGTEDIIENNENGYIISNRDNEIYVSSMEKIINNENQRKRLGKNAIKTSKKFYKDEILKIWFKILDRDV